MRQTRLPGLVLVLLWVPLVALPVHVAAQSTDRCTRPLVNAKGTSNVPVVVSSTAVEVLAQNSNRCDAIVKSTGTGSVVCLPTVQGTPTTTAGITLATGDSIKLTGRSSQPAWKCIRATGTDGAVTTLEHVP